MRVYNMRPSPFLVFLLSFCHYASSHAATYHVAQLHPRAGDENPGTAALPWMTISRAARTLQPGDTVIVRKGTYREWVRPQASGTKDAPITYQAAKGENVVITGTDIFTRWQRVEGEKPIYKFEPWKLNSVVHGAKAPIGRQEQVIVDGKLLKHVLTLDEIEPGCFVSDTDKDALYICLRGGDGPANHTLEVSVRNRCFGFRFRAPGRDHIHVRGFIMRYGRNMAQRGILHVYGKHWVIEDNVIEWSNGCGMKISGEGHIVRNNVTRYHGQLGLGGGHVRCLFENNQLLYNNLKGFPGWECGGCKIVHAYEITMTGTVVVGNEGPGIWFDIDNRKSVISNSLCIDNSGPGIFVEISGTEGIRVLDNLCFRNGLRGGKWGAAGIKLGESESCTVEGNILVGNKEGLAFRLQGPRYPKGRGGEKMKYYTHDHAVRNNVIAFNRDYQVAFWGDNAFFGPHPSAKVNEKNRSKPLLDPEKLSITMDSNLYFKLSGEAGARKQGLFLYGPMWRPKHELFQSLQDWQRAHSFDKNSVFAKPPFMNWQSGDFRLRETAPPWDRFRSDKFPFVRIPMKLLKGK